MPVIGKTRAGIASAQRASFARVFLREQNKKENAPNINVLNQEVNMKHEDIPKLNAGPKVKIRQISNEEYNEIMEKLKRNKKKHSLL